MLTSMINRLNTASVSEDASSYLQKAMATAAKRYKPTTKQATERVAIVGAGAMGRGIALAMLNSGRKVWLFDTHDETLESAYLYIEKQLQRYAQKKDKSNDWLASQLNQLHKASQLNEMHQCQLWIECVPEIMALKCKVLAEMSEAANDTAILASNTSTLDINALSTATNRPDKVIGTHFFIPAHITKLLEVIPADTTSDETLSTIMQMAESLNKSPVIAGICDGFIGNRLFDRFYHEAMYLLEEGAEPQTIDHALESWGMAIGPFRALDMVGNDIPWKVRLERKKNQPQLILPLIGDHLCDKGWFGQKVGRGWYRYESGSRKALINQDINKLLSQSRKTLNLSQRTISDEEIIDRCILAVIHEALSILSEGIARSGSDIDVVYVNGYGFPKSLGGPMKLADHLGLSVISDRFSHYKNSDHYSAPLWQPSDLLNHLATTGQTLSHYEVENV